MTRIKILPIALIALLLCSGSIQAKILLQFPFAGSTVELLDSAAAAIENAKSDAYTRALTPFDLQIRLGIQQGATEKDYLSRSASQARSWPKDEQEQLKKAFDEIDAFLKSTGVKLQLPAKIQLIKTEGKEEFEAEGYTRNNRIMLHVSASQPISTHLVAHELFHVYSRFNEKKRDELYAIFGFKKCSRINSAAAMSGRVITNPDCPFTEHYLTLKANETPEDMVLQLYSKNDYKPEYNLGDYANLCLLRVAGSDNNKQPVLKDGKGVIYELDSVSDLITHIGTNTSYVLHPEEIAAEHFALCVVRQEVPQPAFIVNFMKVLKD